MVSLHSEHKRIFNFILALIYNLWCSFPMDFYYSPYCSILYYKIVVYKSECQAWHILMNSYYPISNMWQMHVLQYLQFSIKQDFFFILNIYYLFMKSHKISMRYSNVSQVSSLISWEYQNHVRKFIWLEFSHTIRFSHNHQVSGPHHTHVLTH